MRLRLLMIERHKQIVRVVFLALLALSYGISRDIKNILSGADQVANYSIYISIYYFIYVYYASCVVFVTGFGRNIFNWYVASLHLVMISLSIACVCIDLLDMYPNFQYERIIIFSSLLVLNLLLICQRFEDGHKHG